MAAEYEVNIKINTQKVETDLNTIDRKIKNLGKSTTSKEKSLERIVDKRARLMNRINEMEAKGLKVSKLRAQMGKATEQQSRRDLANAQKEYRVLERSIRLEQSKLRILRSQREGFPASPIRGIRSMMGSPAQIAASGRQRVSPIGGRIDIAGSPAQMEAIRKLEMAEIRADKNAHFAELRLIQKRQKIQLDNVDKLFRANERELEKFNRKLEAADKARQKRLAGANAGRGQFGPAAPGVQGPRQMIASPIGGATNIPGSPAFLRRQQRIKTLEQVGLGAGFPLLFGGGAGSVIGGGLGGLTGSFGAQIAFSAIGQQIDQFVAGVAAIGTALTSASGTVEMFREKNLFSSDAVKKHAFELEQQGKMQELATLLAKDLASQIGTNAVKSFQDLGGEVKEFLDTVNHLFVAVGGFVAGPLAKLLDAINTVLGGVSTDIKFGSLRDSLTGEARAEFDAIVARERGTRKLTGREKQSAIRRGESTDPVEGRLTTAVKERVLQDPAIAALRQKINVTGQTTLDDTLGFKPKKDSAAEEQKRIDKRIAALQIEAAKIAEISAFKDRIAAAEAAEDTMLVIRLQGEQQLKEIESSRLDKLIGVTTQRERDAINLVAQAEKTAAIAQTEREINAEYLRRQNLFDDTVEDLEHQLALATATSEAERERLRIEKKLQKLREDGLDDTQAGRIGQLMENLATANSPINKFITQSVESLNNLEQHAVQVSQGIGNAIGNSLVNGLQNLVTGATSVKEVFADMLKSIADVLAKQAAQMIATYIAIGIARLFAGMGGGGNEGGLNIDGVQQYTSNLDMDLGPNMFPLAAPNAAGGFISSPTTALVGEGGESEYIIPESKMRESMARYSRGARGSSVIPEAGGSGTSGEGGGTAVAAPIDVRYTVERINSVDYVTADQFQAGMRQAANQGAKQGEQQTLRRLQMSSGTRKRLGM